MARKRVSSPSLIPTENPDGFLGMKDFHRAANAEMQAIKKMRMID
jgi:hypothetical protein